MGVQSSKFQGSWFMGIQALSRSEIQESERNNYWDSIWRQAIKQTVMVKQKLVSALKQHFWHYMCVFVLHQEILQFSVDLSWVFYHSVQSDAVCLELGSDYPQGKGLRATRLPPTSDATWESQVVHCSYDWAAVNQGLPWPPLQVGWFARMAHRTQEGMYLRITVHY